MLRRDAARRRREEADYRATPPSALAGADAWAGQPEGADPWADGDDTLTLLFLCCHPAVTPASQVALTLRAVGGLSTAAIAAAFGVPEATMGQRISRAKQQVKAAGARFTAPAPADRGQRLKVVQQVLYLIFNEGYAAAAGESLQRADLAAEAIRLTRLLVRLQPDDAETAGLLALMLLTDARREARVAPDGALVPLTEQDRAHWDQALIAEGTALTARALAASRGLGPYQLQAAIAAVHAEAPSVGETDWAQVLALYELLARVAPGPMTALGRAVAVAMTRGPAAGLTATDELAAALGRHHRYHAVRGHLLEMAGDPAAAAAAYDRAWRYATNQAERRYLAGQRERAAAVTTGPADGLAAEPEPPARP